MRIDALPERKAREAERLGAAAAAVEADLARFVRRRGGRFLVFGSAARGDLGFASDLDIMVDVPEPLEEAASRAAERSTSRHGIRLDLHS